MFHTDLMKAGFCVCNLERAESICLWNESCWHLSSGQSRWAVFQSMSRRRRTHGRTSWSSGVNRWRYRRSSYCETITIWTIKQSSVFCMTINHICQQNLKKSEMTTFIKKLFLPPDEQKQAKWSINLLRIVWPTTLKNILFLPYFPRKALGDMEPRPDDDDVLLPEPIESGRGNATPLWRLDTRGLAVFSTPTASVKTTVTRVRKHHFFWE